MFSMPSPSSDLRTLITEVAPFILWACKKVPGKITINKIENWLCSSVLEKTFSTSWNCSSYFMYLIWLFVLWFKEDTKHNVQLVLALFSICLHNDKYTFDLVPRNSNYSPQKSVTLIESKNAVGIHNILTWGSFFSHGVHYVISNASLATSLSILKDKITRRHVQTGY